MVSLVGQLVKRVIFLYSESDVDLHEKERGQSYRIISTVDSAQHKSNGTLRGPSSVA